MGPFLKTANHQSTETLTVSAVTQKSDFYQLAHFCRQLSNKQLALKQLDWLIQNEQWTLCLGVENANQLPQVKALIKAAFPDCKTDSE